MDGQDKSNQDECITSASVSYANVTSLSYQKSNQGNRKGLFKMYMVWQKTKVEYEDTTTT